MRRRYCAGELGEYGLKTDGRGKYSLTAVHKFGPFWSFLEMAGSRPDRPLRTPGLLLRPVISLGDLLQLWHPTSHLHWGSRAMIRQSLHSPPHWGPQFLDPDIFRTESPSSTVRHKSPSQQILKNKHVLESQGDVLEKSQGRHITKIQFKG